MIIAQNNMQAMLNVGQSVPFVQVSQTVPNDPTGRVQTVQYIDVGTTLTITPTINPDGYVNLTVSQTDNSATNDVQFDAPIINKREATTQVFIRDGQTTVIGGLADNTSNNSTSGIPILSSIPFIGHWLFGNTTQHKDATSSTCSSRRTSSRATRTSTRLRKRGQERQRTAEPNVPPDAS